MLIIVLLQLSSIILCLGHEGRVDRRAINGGQLSIHERSFYVRIVALMQGIQKNGEPYWRISKSQIDCGGTAIDPRFVLTAHSCFLSDTDKVKGIAVSSGDFTDEDTFDSKEHMQIQAVKYLHTTLDNPRGTGPAPDNIGYDMAILELKNPMFSKMIPLCQNDDPLRFVKALGMGGKRNGWMGAFPNTLYEAKFQVTTESYCAIEIQPNWRGCMMGNMDVCKKRPPFVRDQITSEICTCTGDLGGPLLAVHPRTDEALCLYGVISNSYSRGRFASLPIQFTSQCNDATYFERVAFYRGWIYSVINGEASSHVKQFTESSKMTKLLFNLAQEE